MVEVDAIEPLVSRKKVFNRRESQFARNRSENGSDDILDESSYSDSDAVQS